MDYKIAVKKYIDNYEIFRKLEKYVELIEEKNKVMNLTGFTGDRLWKEGIFESLLCMDALVNADDKEILDIGAGAGFPSIPFAIAHPDKHVTIIEPLQKRIVFLDEVIQELNLNVTLIVDRAEESDQIEKFDVITARAVAPLKALVEISHKLGKIGAKFSWIKGPGVQEEILEAQKIFGKINAVPRVKKIDFIGSNKEINLVEYSKVGPTPAGIPRNWAQIVK